MLLHIKNVQSANHCFTFVVKLPEGKRLITKVLAIDATLLFTNRIHGNVFQFSQQFSSHPKKKLSVIQDVLDGGSIVAHQHDFGQGLSSKIVQSWATIGSIDRLEDVI